MARHYGNAIHILLKMSIQRKIIKVQLYTDLIKLVEGGLNFGFGNF